MTWHVFACVFSGPCESMRFFCHGVHWQTNRHSREISEIVPARTRAHTHAEITQTPLSCGGDECDVDSLSLLIHTYIQTCMLLCLYKYTFVMCLFAFLSAPGSILCFSESVDCLSLIVMYLPVFLVFLFCVFVSRCADKQTQ